MSEWNSIKDVQPKEPGTSDYEMFHDKCYYWLWCVRNKNDRRFHSPMSFHFDKKEDAEKFLELISKAK